MTPETLLHHDDHGTLWADDLAGASAYADAHTAYEAALAVRALRLARGEQPLGYKVGFTNRNIWPRYNVFAPIWGTVWNTTHTACDGDGVLVIARTCQPRIEPECVFGLRAAPPPNTSLDELFEAIDWVATGFEVVQSHRPEWKFSAPETMADNGLHARLLVGPRRPVTELAHDAVTLHAVLAAATVSLHRGHELVDEGVGANVLDGPLLALHHFLRELRACPGAPELGAGDVITTGTWTDAWPVKVGERWSARFASPLSDLSVRFE
jgi:2-oxo-3-hexenedioate decarboxylase